MNGATAKIVRKSTRLASENMSRRVKRLLNATPTPDRAALKRRLKPDVIPREVLPSPRKKRAAAEPDKNPCPTRRRQQRRNHMAWVMKRAKAVPAWQQNTRDGKPEG